MEIPPCSDITVRHIGAILEIRRARGGEARDSWNRVGEVGGEAGGRREELKEGGR